MDELKILSGVNLSFVEFSEFLSLTEKDFVPPLCSRINVSEYYHKLAQNAEFIACYDECCLVGLTAVYCNDEVHKTTYGTFMAVLSEYRGRKIASRLLEEVEKMSLLKGMRKLKMKTTNEKAYRCYLKNGYELVETQYLPEYKLNRYFLEKKI